MGDVVEKLCLGAAEFLKADETELDEWVVGAGKRMLAGEDTAVPNDISPELARALAYTTYVDGVTDGRQAARSFGLIAASVRGAPEQFFFERQVLDILYTPWEPARTELLLAPHRKVDQACNKPIRREKQPGPNDPCSCGSGKKYKKCCRP